MAKLDLDENQAAYQIRSYTPGALKINNTIYHTSLIVSANRLIQPWEPQSISALTTETLDIIKELKPTILLIGTGAEHHLINPDIYGELINLGIGVEIMNTSAACRTFSALSAEDRNVAAALIIR
jgi:uncharacterized protein